MQVSGILDLLLHAIRGIKELPCQREWSRPTRDVTEGFITSADDMRPEATLLIGLSYYALQHQTLIAKRADA